MRIAFGSDERTHLTDFIEQELRSRGHRVELVGPPAGQRLQWVDVAEAVAERVSSTDADEGVLCCWTGTGVSMAANKVPGVRAWNDANLLCLSLRTTTEALAGEILEAWFSAAADQSEAENVGKLKELDRQYRAPKVPVPAEWKKGRD